MIDVERFLLNSGYGPNDMRKAEIHYGELVQLCTKLIAQDREEREAATYRCERCGLDRRLYYCPCNEPDSLSAKLVRLARALSDKLRAIKENESYQAVWDLAYAHGQNYTGPNFKEELAAVDAALQEISLTERGTPP